MDRLETTGYLAADGFEAQLEEELGAGSIRGRHGRLILADGAARSAAWAANVWHDVTEIEFESISQAAKALRDMQRNWALYPHRLHRRASLIQEKLPHVSARPLVFPAALPKAPLGSWMLLDANRLLASPHCSSAFANGAVEFVENKSAPPNRAYLKLWEALTLADRWPRPGEVCLDLGASPGGWSWVLQSLDARVIAIDRAPLDPEIAALPGIEYRAASAFALEPQSVGPVDWLCSDIVCYPAKLLELVMRWLESGLARNFVCTLKFQGETDHGASAAFAAIPGSRLMHLHHNKHELTWMRLAA
ncbi:MAG TPA: SAM-dependent methyltransferase [Verrucomicrobiae bacterium]|nr:SAM-dependent methyltransferase [Verrucomicrobiae bacterium]